MSGLFSDLVWRASNSISFLTLHFCLFFNANSYNAGRLREESKRLCKKTNSVALFSKLETAWVTSGYTKLLASVLLCQCQIIRPKTGSDNRWRVQMFL